MRSSYPAEYINIYEKILSLPPLTVSLLLSPSTETRREIGFDVAADSSNIHFWKALRLVAGAAITVTVMGNRGAALIWLH